MLTYGSPRCHIWSFTAATNEYRNGCPCTLDLFFTGTILHIYVTVDISTLMTLNLSVMSMLHCGMERGVFMALAVRTTLLHGSVRLSLNPPQMI